MTSNLVVNLTFTEYVCEVQKSRPKNRAGFGEWEQPIDVADVGAPGSKRLGRRRAYWAADGLCLRIVLEYREVVPAQPPQCPQWPPLPE